MIALKDKDAYKEGTTWTNDEPYSDSKGYYYWKGGSLDGKNIVAAGCVAFAFTLSDEAFGSLPARMYASNEFKFEDIKVGDILRVNTDTHTVIVLEVSDGGVVIAEGNDSGKVHWGRAIAKDVVMRDTSHYITRYPEGYIPPDDPEADKPIADGTLEGGLTWNLTKVGTLTISGTGAMPGFNSAGEQPWNSYSSQIHNVVIENGVTSIGSCAFGGCGSLSAKIPDSVTTIGNSAFRGSSILAVTIPSSVKTVGDSAFRECNNLCTVTVSEGMETIAPNAFRACTSLTSISLPSSIGKVGDGAFMECTEMKGATFASGSKQVTLGDNMFTRCYNLMDVTLASNINCIGKEMFINCLMITRIEIPQGVENIGEKAFASCSRLNIVTIPDSVTTIGTAAFSACSLTDVYFSGTEAQWNKISKQGDVASAVSKATIHYNTPATRPDPNPDDGDDNNTGDDNGNNDDNTGDDNGNSGNNDNNTGDNSSDTSNNPENEHGGDNPDNTSGEGNLDENGSDINAVVETWKPTTPDEIKRYVYVGKEAIQYTLPQDNAYPIDIENAMQGPMCFQSFEAVLGDYTIGRTYNIYALSDTIYSTDEEIQITIEIPSAIYEKDREYKMICVTKGGLPVIYDDLDSDPETITIETNKFYAYALIYK